MTFWLGVAALALLGALALLVPALRARSGGEGDSATGDHLRRFAELDTDLANGEVAADIAPALREELERAVLDALPARPPAGAARTAGNHALLWLCALAVPAIALAVYLAHGSPRIAEFVAAHPGRALSEPANALELLLGEVRERVAAAPQDREAWEVLARANMQLGRYDEAIAAAEHLRTLAPQDSGALLVLVDALAMQAGGELDGRPLALLDEILGFDPDNISALVLSGIAREKAGDRAAAVTAWQRAVAAMPPDEPLRDELEAMIAGRSAPPLAEAPPAAAAPAAAAPVTVTVKVSLDAALAARAPAGASLFVLARAIDGPRVPLAVARHTLADLPLTVTLDSSMAMMPGTSLADFAQVEVVARISTSGQPMAAAGDLEGRSAPLDPRAGTPVEVVIDRVLDAAATAP